MREDLVEEGPGKERTLQKGHLIVGVPYRGGALSRGHLEEGGPQRCCLAEIGRAESEHKDHSNSFLTPPPIYPPSESPPSFPSPFRHGSNPLQSHNSPLPTRYQ